MPNISLNGFKMAYIDFTKCKLLSPSKCKSDYKSQCS